MSNQASSAISCRFFPPRGKTTALSVALACLFTALPHPASANPVIVDYPVSIDSPDTDAVTVDNGGTVTVKETGSIKTTRDGSNAIFAGTDASVVNKGSIVTGGTYTGTGLSNARFSDGILAGAGSRIANHGTVATSGNSAYAIYAQDGSTIINTGTVTTGGQNANGLMGEDHVTIENKGDVTTSGAGSYGMRGKENAVLINSGTVSTTGDYVEHDPFDGAQNTATAMQGGQNAGLVNTGTLHTQGMGASGMAGGDGSTLYNGPTGTILVEASDNTVYANGMMGGAHTQLVNDGRVRTTGVSIFGLFGNTGSTLVNNGTVVTGGERGNGMVGEDGTSLTNTGIIRTAGDGASGMTDKTGSVVINSGEIDTSGSTVPDNPINHYPNYASGITIEGDNATVVNTGSISTAGTGGHGIYLAGTGNTVANTGFIASAGGAELYVAGKTAADPASATVTAWATEAGKQNVFLVAGGSTLHFDRASLILRPASDGRSFGKTFRFSDMVDNVNGGGTLDGSIASVSSVMPMLSATSSGDTPANLTYTLSVDASRSYGQQANVTAVRNMQNRMWLTSRTVSSALANAFASSEDNSVFARSYYLNAGSSGDAVSSSDSVGFVFGGTKRIHPDFLLGFHAGYEHTDMDAGQAGLKGDSDSWLLGLHSRYAITPSAFVRGQLTGSVSRSDYDFAMTGDSASDKRTEYALFANVTGGYDFRVNDANTLTPEVGLAYLYMRNPSMDARWNNACNRYMDVHFDSASYRAAFATAALRWTGAFEQQSASVKPTLALGIRQTLTDGEIDGDMRFIGNRYGSYVSDDKTVGTMEAGLQFTQKNMTMTVRYNGNFGSDTHDNIVWGEIGYAF